VRHAKDFLDEAALATKLKITNARKAKTVRSIKALEAVDFVDTRSV
jgi:hypothetical protein